MTKPFEVLNYKLALQEVICALQDCIGDLEYEESDGWMSGQVHVDCYKDALKVIAKYKDVWNADT